MRRTGNHGIMPRSVNSLVSSGAVTGFSSRCGQMHHPLTQHTHTPCATFVSKTCNCSILDDLTRLTRACDSSCSWRGHSRPCLSLLRHRVPNDVFGLVFEGRVFFGVSYGNVRTKYIFMKRRKSLFITKTGPHQQRTRAVRFSRARCLLPDWLIGYAFYSYDV